MNIYNKSTPRFTLTKHIKERMQERHITMAEILAVFPKGNIIACTYSKKHRSYYRIVNNLLVAFALKEDDELVLITTFKPNNLTTKAAH